MESSSEFQYHTACPKCGSSDANGVYDDGSSYCFSCNTYFKSTEGGEQRVSKKHKAPAEFVEGEIKMLKARNVNEATCSRYGYKVGVHKGEAVQVAPYFWDGEMVAQHLRFPDKRFAWVGDVSKLQLFGQQRFKAKGKRLVITEGEIDAMSISQAFQNKWEVVSVPNGASNAHKYVAQNLEFCMGYPEVVIAFDNDTPGREASERVALLFKPGQAKIVHWEDGIKDANDLLKAGRVKDITIAIYEAKVWRPDGIVNGSELKAAMENRFDLDPTVGAYPLPYPKLNSTTYGLRKSELWTFTAGSGLGKSTVVAEIAYDLLKQGLKIGYVALEENNEFSAERMMSIHLNKRLHLDRTGVSKEEYMDAFEATAGSGRFFLYDHFGSLESDNLMSKIRYLAVGCECDFIVIDHISITVSGISHEEGGDERRIIDNLMTDLSSLTEESGVGILIVSHLRKKSQGKAHEEGGEVSPSELRGSGSIYQLSNRVIALVRNPQDDAEKNIATLKVMKDRFTGRSGTVDTLQYNEETGRLLAVDKDDVDNFSGDDPF